MNPKLINERLSHCALVYVRQSTIGRLTHIRESRHRRDELVQLLGLTVLVRLKILGVLPGHWAESLQADSLLS